MNPKVTKYLSKSKKWQKELEQLRLILLDFPLTEEFKWGVPCYTLENKNLVLIHEFKDYCALLFVKGALLNNPAGILVTQTDNVQSARQIRFTNLEEIATMEPILKAYVQEAIEVEQSGLKVSFKTTSEFNLPKELHDRFNEIPELKTAFDALTPGRQRGYLLYFSAPKQAKTRESRIDKYTQQIFGGKGLDD